MEYNNGYDKSLLGLGRILKEKGETHEAERWLKKLVEEKGSLQAFGYMYLGNIEEEKGKEDERLS